MKIINQYKTGKPAVILMGIVLALTACTKNFRELNTDPNRPKEITPGVMLGQMQYRIINTNVNTARDFTHQLMQVDAPRSSTSGGGLHRYVLNPGQAVWSNYYTYLTDVEEIYSLSAKLNEPNYRAIALVYKSWAYSILTDLYGDIPYSQAIHAVDGVLQVPFDKQKEVYTSLLANLDSANLLFDQTRALTYGGDLVYSANAVTGGVNPGIVKWRKFANSLKMRMLLRLWKKNGEINVSEQLTAMLADPAKYPVFTSNADEAIFRYPGTFPYFNPFYNARQVDWRDGNYVTNFFIGKMNADEDPRRAIWWIPVGGVYKGIESGYPTTTEYPVGANSSYTDALKTLPQLGIMMTYSELQSIKAELALRGFNTGLTAKQHYDASITASMVQWGVTMPADYLAKPGVVFDASGTFDQQLEQVMLQKYYAYFFVDYQSWFEKRRTGYP
ncbi:MAG: SusD/RagB family nutrient-binding outer membrane lipoprotein, partial [Chitinophagaceae bacterium]